MDFGLDGKVAIVTGAARGIGMQIALTLAKEKVNIIIADFDYEGAKKVEEKILSMGIGALAIETDITDTAIVAGMVEKVMAEFGRIDVLVNNACAPIRRTPFLEIDIKEWQEVIRVNLEGTFICSQAVATVMKKSRKGKIINISSFAAHLPAAGFSAYSASKAGIELLSRTMAGELGEFGINVNFIRPGVIETEITKQWHEGEVGEKMLKPIALKRFGDPSEVGCLVAFLASDKADYISGVPISIDGGKYAVQQ